MLPKLWLLGISKALNLLTARYNQVDVGETATKSEHAIVLYDGVCNLCNSLVQFILRRDPTGYFQFASLQGSIGAMKLRQCGLDPEQRMTVVVIEGGHAYTKSTAALRIFRRLTGVWPVLFWGISIPRPVRDGVYDFVARRRYRWFGRRDSCAVPEPGWRERFLDEA